MGRHHTHTHTHTHTHIHTCTHTCTHTHVNTHPRLDATKRTLTCIRESERTQAHIHTRVCTATLTRAYTLQNTHTHTHTHTRVHGAGVPNAVVEVWQADAEGNYAPTEGWRYPRLRYDYRQGRGETFVCRATVNADASGKYTFNTSESV